jgi:hypothetical protein
VIGIQAHNTLVVVSLFYQLSVPCLTKQDILLNSNFSYNFGFRFRFRFRYALSLGFGFGSD